MPMQPNPSLKGTGVSDYSEKWIGVFGTTKISGAAGGEFQTLVVETCYARDRPGLFLSSTTVMFLSAVRRSVRQERKARRG
ncbi:MAG: hypothetical protein ABL933_10020 [Methyloglobulus sp.]|nr:hypothetical protein [Methyloglobulus sp.]